MRKVVPLAVAAGFLVASGGAFGAVEASAKTVELSVDGVTQQVRTYQGTVGQLLRANDLTVGGHDVVSPSASTNLSKGQKVTVSYGRPIDLTLDGQHSQLWTTALTVEDVVDELGVRPESEVSAPLDTPIDRDGMQLEISSAKKITVASGVDPSEDIITTASTVAEALGAKGIKLGDKDKVDPDRSSQITDGMTITVEFRDEKRTTKEVTIPNKTVTKKSDDVPAGETKVEQEGRQGKAKEEWVEKFVNGKSVSKERVKRTVVTEPQDRIVVEGTGPANDSGSNPGSSSGGSDGSGGSGGSDDSGEESGGTPTGQTETCEASNYWQGQMTANGEQFNPDAMTAAHKTLPFDTKVKVTNLSNGKSVVVRINDRGPYIGGRCIDLSRGSFAKIASPSAGVAQVKLEILK